MSIKNSKNFNKLSDEAKKKAKDDLEFQLINLDKLLEMELPENQWIVDRFIPKEGITILAGAPSTYKTWIVLQIALSVSVGGELFGCFKTDQTGVLIVDEENHLNLLKKRIKLLGVSEGLPVYFLSKNGFTVENKDQIQKIIGICKKFNIGVVIFDSLIRINTADENDASKMSGVFKRIGNFSKAGLTVILTHHEKKDNGINLSPQSKMRGSSDILASVDALNSIRRDRNNKYRLTIEQSKMRMDEEINAFDVVVEKEANLIRFRYLGEAEVRKTKSQQSEEAIKKLLLEHPEGISKTEIKKEIAELKNIGQRTIQDELNSLISEGIIETKSGGLGNTQVCFIKDNNELAK